MITRRQAKLQRLTAAAESSAPTPDPTPPAVTLVCLPDDALLAVLSHLPPRQLLVCRAVCRRLRAVCLHRDLWRAVHVEKDVDAGLLRAALHLAPCLRKITRWFGSLASLAAVVAETACVVSEVNLCVRDSSEHEAALATDIILKLSALGGVRKLRLSVSCEMDTACMRLVKSIYRLHGLADLEFNNGTGKPLPGGWCHPKKTPSLTRLQYYSYYTARDPFAELLLRTHAATLEEVDLYSTEAIPTSLLAALPRLRSLTLTCCPSNDLSRLVELPNLSMLKLRYGESTSDNFPVLPVGTLNFLREARHLRRVHLELPWNASATVPLIALRASRSAPALESLEVYGAGKPDAWELVATVPPRFPALKTLTMSCVPSDEFLRAVGPDALPGLNELLVHYPDDTCLHAWMHDPAIQDVLARNPRLHLRVHLGGVPESCSCRWCRLGCHKLIGGDECYEFSFSAHSKGGDCPVDCYQVVG